MTTKFSFKFSFKIPPSLNNNLPPEVAKAYADGFTLMEAWRRYRGFTRKEVAARAGIVLISESPKDYKYWLRLNSTIDHFKLPIVTWIIENNSYILF